MLDNGIAKKKRFWLCKYRKSGLVAAVITTQSCCTSQYVRRCGISNSQYLMLIELLSTFIDVRVSSQDRNACSLDAPYQKSTSQLMFSLVKRHRITETVFANRN